MSRSIKGRSSSSNTTTRARNPRLHIMKENTEDAVGASASSAAIVDATKNKSTTTKKRRSNNILKEQDTNASSSLPKRRRILKKNEKANSSQPMPPMPPLPDVERHGVEEYFESTPGSSGDLENGGDDGQKKKKKKKKKPKRPLNAYFLFANDIRDQVKAAHPDLPNTQIVSLAVLYLRIVLIFSPIHLITNVSYTFIL